MWGLPVVDGTGVLPVAFAAEALREGDVDHRCYFAHDGAFSGVLLAAAGMESASVQNTPSEPRRFHLRSPGSVIFSMRHAPPSISMERLEGKFAAQSLSLLPRTK